MPSLRHRLAERWSIPPAELKALGWGVALHALVLASLYTVRPLRDELGILSGVQDLQWLFTGTFAGLLVVVPAYGWAVSRLGRRRLVPGVIVALGVGLVVAYVAWQLAGADARPAVAAASFIGLSVFNMVVVSVFWSLMADSFGHAAGQRWFGVLAGGGSLGAVAGPAVANGVLATAEPVTLLLVAAGLLAAAALAADRVAATTRGETAARPMGGSVLAGVRSVVRTPMLRGVTAYLLAMTWISTILYFEQAQIVAAEVEDSARRTILFARMDLVVNALAVTTQLLLTGRILRRIGLASVLLALPVVAGGSLFALALWPTLGVLVGVQVARRAVNYALSKPARELLYTVVDREARYKGKNVVDTIVYRGGDAVAGWAFAGLQGLGLSLPVIAGLGLPVAAVWARYALRLGRLARA